MASNQSEIYRLLEEMANGRSLSAQERARVAAALEADPGIEAYWADLQAIDQRLEASLKRRYPKPGSHNIAPIITAVHQRHRRQQVMSKFTTAMQASVALILFAVVGIAWFGWSAFLTQNDPIEPLAPAVQETPDATPVPETSDAIPEVTLSGTVESFVIGLNEPTYEVVTIDGFGTVEIRQGETVELSVETDSGYQSRIKVNDSTGRLELGNIYAEDGLRPPLIYRLTVPDLNEIRVSGSATMIIFDLETDELNVSVSGGAAVDLDSSTIDTLTVEGSGSGALRLSGSCQIDLIFEDLRGGASIDRDGCE